MNGRSSLSSTDNIVSDLCRIVGHGAAWLQHQLIATYSNALMLPSGCWRDARPWVKRLRAVSNLTLQSQPRRVTTIVAMVDAKSP
jgi:hypothetical protein